MVTQEEKQIIAMCNIARRVGLFMFDEMMKSLIIPDGLIGPAMIYMTERIKGMHQLIENDIKANLEETGQIFNYNTEEMKRSISILRKSSIKDFKDFNDLYDIEKHKYRNEEIKRR